MSQRRNFRLYVRHYCSKCGSRVFPFDKYENLTEYTPKVGKPHTPIKRPLLYSYNQRDPDNRVAWCWACDKMMPCERLTEREIYRLYIARDGVITRKGVKLCKYG
jgi:hypothetical protein